MVFIFKYGIQACLEINPDHLPDFLRYFITNFLNHFETIFAARIFFRHNNLLVF